MRSWKLSLVICLTLAAGGCSRTDDGTVVIPRSLDMRRVDLGPLDLRHPGRLRPQETRPIVVAATPEPFPVSPLAGTSRRSRNPKAVAGNRRASQSAARAATPQAPSSPLACAPATQKGKRIHMLCD